MSAGSTGSEATCYRHPDRQAPLGCSRCGRPICIDDAIDAPVGYLCPECAQHPARVQRVQKRVARSQTIMATWTLLGLIAVAFLVQQVADEFTLAGGLFGPEVQNGEVWRLVTSAFLHSPDFFLHVGFNGYLLYLLGRMLEPGIGSARFLAVYFAGMFGGAFGALLLSFNSLTIGASGAVFGLMGGAMVLMRQRGINPWKTNIGVLVGINLVFTFMASGISIGGHLGGLIGGALAALPMAKAYDGQRTAMAWGIVVVLAAMSLAVGLLGPVL